MGDILNGTVHHGELGIDNTPNSSSSAAISTDKISKYAYFIECAQSSIEKHEEFRDLYGDKLFNTIYAAATSGKLDKFRRAINDIGQLAADDAEITSYFASKDRYPFVLDE